MPTRKDAIFIDKNIQEPPALDFKQLLEEGIDAVQHMAGENWTDYNVHDPGVTILEQLCYALTELGYRANFAFEDLLASQFDLEHTQDTFYSTARILPSSPVTINDFRKLLIDRVKGLRNIWIEPLNVSKDASQIRGVYMAFAEASPDSIHTDEDIKRLKKDIWDNISKYTNLSEAFERVAVLQRINIYVRAEIELLYEADVDEVHAHLLFNLSRSMTRPMEFKSLETMLEEGKTVNEIFEGPRLRNGFVNDEDLVKKIRIINATTFVTPIKNVQGVLHVRSLYVTSDEVDEPEIDTNDLDIDAVDTGFVGLGQIPAFGNELSENGEQLIRYFKHKTEVKPNISNVKKILEGLVQTAEVSYDYSRSTYYDLAVPKGKKTDIAAYYSFQNHFPAIYGLGHMGLPPAIRGKKRDAILQLKGYLMLFDQILANYFAQLEHFSDLFSLKQDIQRTYFAGIIDSLEGIRGMVTHLDSNLPEPVFNERLRAIAHRSLAAIDNFDDRRNRFLDHLLARFGEHLGHYGISRFNTYHTDEAYKKELIRIKTNLLSAIVKFSKNRSRSFDYSKEYWGTSNISFMEWKLKLLLGINTKSVKLAARNHALWLYFHQSDPLDVKELFDHLHAQKIEPVDAELHLLEPDAERDTGNIDILKCLHMDADLITGIFEPGSLAMVHHPLCHEKKFLLLFAKELDTRNITEEHRKLLEQIIYLFHEVGNEDKRYRMPGSKHNYIIEFQKNPATGIYDVLSTKIWKEIGSFRTREEATEAADKLYAHVRRLNIESEGFYLVDHIQLRPRNPKIAYGIHFSNREKNVSFDSAQQFDFYDLQLNTVKLVYRLRKATPEYRSVKGGIVVHMMEGNENLGHNTQVFPNEAEARAYVENALKPFLESFRGIDFFDTDTVQIYKSYGAANIDGDDFSFRLTIVLPSWTARFSNPEFRQALENAFRMECPAHIGIDFRWLSFTDLLHFESLYSPWLDVLRSENSQIETLNDYSSRILQFLKDKQEKTEEPVQKKPQ